MISPSVFPSILALSGLLLIVSTQTSAFVYHVRPVQLSDAIVRRLKEHGLFDRIRPIFLQKTSVEGGSSEEKSGEPAEASDNDEEEDQASSASSAADLRTRYLKSRNLQRGNGQRYLPLAEYLRRSLFIKRAMMMMDRQPLRFG